MMRARNKIKTSVSYRIFTVAAYILILFWVFICIAPFVHMVAVSFSDSKWADSYQVGLWPRDFTLEYYQKAFTNPQIISSLMISVKRTVLGVLIELFVTVIASYPLSKDKREFPGRDIVSALFIFCMIFGGGLVPTFIIVSKELNLADTVWALVLPGAVNIGNIILMMNFMRQLPKEIEESALLDGCGYFRTLLQIILPLSVNSILTIVMFVTIGHWNAWLDGMIYMQSVERYPMSTFLYSIRKRLENIKTLEDMELVTKYSQQGLIMTYVVICTMPVLVLYPILQKYVKKGLTVGSVKG